MTYKVYGDYFESGELANTDKFATFQPNKNLILKAIRTKIIVNNDPTYTDITAKLYSNAIVSGNNTPALLIANSLTTFTKAEVTDQDNGIRELYFNFDFIPLVDEDFYHIVMAATGYVFSTSSHLAWKKGWEDRIYTADNPVAFSQLAVSPYDMTIIGAPQ